MNLLTKPASPKLRKIFLAVMAICAVLMIVIGQVYGGFYLGEFFTGGLSPA